MNKQLRNMMAEMESWEAAIEFGIPEDDWAGYSVRKRIDDLYIACLASAFDALRIEKIEVRETILVEIARILVMFSNSAAARHLSGVEKKLNQIYSAALFYIAGFPATSILLSRHLDSRENASEEEYFLLNFLGHRIEKDDRWVSSLLESTNDESFLSFEMIRAIFKDKVTSGLQDDPRKFIVSKLALSCMDRFIETNVWGALRQYAANYTHAAWLPFLGSKKAIWELLPSQMAAIKLGLLGNTDETYSIQMPTSSGKTALCELLIYHEVKIRNHRVLFLVPFRALAAEIREGMSRRLMEAGVRVIASHGGNIPTKSETITVENADVLIITPEKFIALAQVAPELNNQYQTIICDEGHLIDDDSRGLQYELLLTKLKGTEFSPRKIVFISAILPNVDEIHGWLGGKPNHLAQSNYKPVETDYAFLTPQPGKKDCWQLDVNPIFERPRSYFLKNFLVKGDFRYLNPSTNHQKLIGGWNSYLALSCAAALKARRSGAVALFTTSRGTNGIRGLAEKLISMCESNVLVAQKSPVTSDRLPVLLEFIEFLLGHDYLLTRLLMFGAGFHHGMLPQEVRRVMEEGIHDGTITILLCTTTLAEGVNLPIRTLVVHTVRRYNQDAQKWQYLPNRSIKNIIGRAGRAGKETRGRVLFVNDSEQDQLKKVLRDESMESAHGILYRLIVEINNYLKRTHIELDNEVIDQQTDSTFLSLIDSIDFTLIDLIPADTPQDDINNHIEELLERTLAKRYCDTQELKTCLETVFRLRATKLQKSVSPDIWAILRKSGTSPRFWKFLEEATLLDNELWHTLDNPIDNRWLHEIIIRLLEFPSIGIHTDPDTLSKVICKWISGSTYAEISIECACDIGDILEYICSDIGYRLQEHAAKLCQLAIYRYGEDNISETARNWSSFLQYGLGTMQQLDMFELGGTDRLGVWGISRFLNENNIILRGNDLLAYLRSHSEKFREALRQNERVPKMSVDRICSELRIK